LQGRREHGMGCGGSKPKDEPAPAPPEPVAPVASAAPDPPPAEKPAPVPEKKEEPATAPEPEKEEEEEPAYRFTMNPELPRESQMADTEEWPHWDTPEHHAAVAKIQAIQKGKNVRKSMKKMTSSTEGGSTESLTKAESVPNLIEGIGSFFGGLFGGDKKEVTRKDGVRV